MAIPKVFLKLVTRNTYMDRTMSSIRPSRVEAVTCVQSRRYRATEQKLQIIKETYKPGSSVNLVLGDDYRSNWHWEILARNGTCRFGTGRLRWIDLVLSLTTGFSEMTLNSVQTKNSDTLWHPSYVVALPRHHWETGSLEGTHPVKLQGYLCRATSLIHSR